MSTTTWWDAPAEVRVEMEIALRARVLEQPLASVSAWREFLLSGADLFGCVGGSLWIPDSAQHIRCAIFASRVEMEMFKQQTRELTFSPGVGLPGRVWLRGVPEFIENVILDDNFPRLRGAIRDVVRGLMAFPIMKQGAPVAVLELFSRSSILVDDSTFTAMQRFGEFVGEQFSPDSIIDD